MVNMLKPNLDEIAELLKKVAERNGSKLPELYRIAWQAYLGALAVNSGDVFDHNDYIELRDKGYFLTFDDDPDTNDPVLAISCGKHYLQDEDELPDGIFIMETEFEGLHRKILSDSKHLGGKLTEPFAVAWYGKLLGLRQCEVISNKEYEQLSAMLPEIMNNPVNEVEAFMNRYAKG